MSMKYAVLFGALLCSASNADEVKYAMRFTFTGKEAQKMEVAGDFCQWEPLPMVHRGSGIWVRTFYVSPGTYQYKLKSGDNWFLDPANSEQVDDGKGVINSAITVSPPPSPKIPPAPGARIFTPDTLIKFDIPHSGRSWSFARKFAEARGDKLNQKEAETNQVHVGVLLPKNFDPAKVWPILVVNAPGGFSNVGHLDCCFVEAADAGFVAVAADSPISRFFAAASTLDYLSSRFPGLERWPVACGGFSGGAKISGEIAAMLMESGRRVIGIWMGGCNEDYASSGLNLYKPNAAAFKRVPIFLAGGLTDDIATPQQVDGVRDSLDKTGFQNIRLERYEGGHHPVPPQMVNAGLSWFIEQTNPGQQRPR